MRYHEKVVHIGKGNDEEPLSAHIDSVQVAVLKPKIEINSKPGTPVQQVQQPLVSQQQLQQQQQQHLQQQLLEEEEADPALSSVEMGGIEPRSPEENVVGPFQCPHCNYITNRKMSLKKHIDAIHDKARIYTYDLEHPLSWSANNRSGGNGMIDGRKINKKSNLM